MRQLFRPSAPGDGLDRPRAPEIGEGALVPLAKDPSPDIAKIVAEGVARICTSTRTTWARMRSPSGDTESFRLFADGLQNIQAQI
ncbi:MAG: hypothetical protein ACXW3Q_09070, partial [Rhodoplanes sp.]